MVRLLCSVSTYGFSIFISAFEETSVKTYELKKVTTTKPSNTSVVEEKVLNSSLSSPMISCMMYIMDKFPVDWQEHRQLFALTATASLFHAHVL